MKVLRITRPGGPEVLEFDERPAPTPGPWDLLVRVHATAINRADLLQIHGAYAAPPGVPADVPGLEYAGEVLATGPLVRRFKVGDRVMGLVGGGAFSEQLITHEREALPVPENLDTSQAAALPEAYLTAFDALVLQGGLRMGESVLIHAVASGVGSAAVQLCRAVGAQTIGTGRNAEKLSRASAWGVGRTVLCDTSPPRFADAVREATGGRGADLALDLVGGNYLPETLRAMALQGRVLLVGLVAGREASAELDVILVRRLHLTGTVLRSRPPEEKMALTLAAERSLLPLFRSGALTPVVDAVYPMREAREALTRMARNETVGKLVLRWE
ncbi:NAD(P)H-quinone oxidoreductase [Vitiosangium sp. GDMCC 1.1324]|uniref:NAD(P)H-quinone oxidoreductase n=1 Tax=Vitiosangium sp. (strain GDMCC 1.1324) TaxID=2138576 RepID=UPI000D357CBF|nr:NAD(P)H-quinone oxidoreductase [Vitiosangium sp. GDMCC 1.1324]PTL84855.1 NAD(P)H-quinone oxidoreductase [Vitiosangium sp. GDMCC 1.1324]